MAPQEALANACDGIADLQNRMATCEVIGSRKYCDRQTSTVHGTGCEQELGAEEAEAQDSVYFTGTIGVLRGYDWVVFGQNRQKCRELGETKLALASRVPFIFTCVLLDSQEGAGRLGAYGSRNHSGIRRRVLSCW